MKKRLQFDSLILVGVAWLTWFFFHQPALYVGSLGSEKFLDVIGFLLILKGVWVRMIARGHKKACSQNGQRLVTTGYYAYVRHPMYWGSFLIGLGFLCLLWPVWAVPVFALLFAGRFRYQIIQEERQCAAMGGEEFEKYRREVPMFFPSWKNWEKMKSREVVRWTEAFSTKEKRALIGLPLLGIYCEVIQEAVLRTRWAVTETIGLFMIALFVLVAAFGWEYRKPLRAS